METMQFLDFDTCNDTNETTVGRIKRETARWEGIGTPAHAPIRILETRRNQHKT